MILVKRKKEGRKTHRAKLLCNFIQGLLGFFDVAPVV